MEFRGSSVVVNRMRLRPEIMNELRANLVLCYLGKNRKSGEIQREVTRRMRQKEEALFESLDELKKIAVCMKNSLQREDLIGFGELLHLEWEQKKKVHKRISDPEINGIYDTARKFGALGWKLLGAGGGGHMLFLCDIEQGEEEMKSMGLWDVKPDYIATNLYEAVLQILTNNKD